MSHFLKAHSFFDYVYLCMFVWEYTHMTTATLGVYTHEYSNAQRSEEGVGSPGAGQC